MTDFRQLQRLMHKDSKLEARKCNFEAYCFKIKKKKKDTGCFPLIRVLLVSVPSTAKSKKKKAVVKNPSHSFLIHFLIGCNGLSLRHWLTRLRFRGVGLKLGTRGWDLSNPAHDFWRGGGLEQSGVAFVSGARHSSDSSLHSLSYSQVFQVALPGRCWKIHSKNIEHPDS